MDSKNLNKTAVKAGIWYTICNIALKGCAFLTLPIFTHMMSTEDFGTYNAYVAYEVIIAAIIGLGLYGTVKNAKLDFKEDFDKYMSSILSISIIALLLALIIINGLYYVFPRFLGFNRLIGNCLILQSYGSFLMTFYGAKLNIEFKYKSFIILSALNTILNILISILLIAYVFPDDKGVGRIVGSAIPLITIGLVLSAIILKRGKQLYNKKYWAYALAIGLPLVPHSVSHSILSQFDRIMIRDYVGESPAGIYSYIYTICTVTYIIAYSLDNAWNPWIYLKLDKKEGQEIKKASKMYIGLFSMLTIGFLCFIPEICKLFAKAEYWSGMDLLYPLVISNFFVFLYMLPVGIEYYNKKTAFISVGTVLAAVLNFVLNYICILKFGYKTAAYTTLFSYFALFVFHWIIAKKYKISEYYDLKYIIKNIILIAVISGIIILTNFNYTLNLIIRYSIIVVALIMIFKYRDLVFKIFKGDKNEKARK